MAKSKEPEPPNDDEPEADEAEGGDEDEDGDEDEEADEAEPVKSTKPDKSAKAPAKSTAKEPATKATAPAAGGKAPPKGPTPVHIGGESIADRLMPHVKKIAVGMGVIALILVAVFGFRWWRDRARQKRTTQLSRAMDVGTREVEKPDPNVKPDPANPAPPTFPTYKDRATAVLAEIDRGAGDVTSAAYKGSLLLDAGNLDGAAAAFQSAAGRKDLEGVLAREGLGFVAEARAQASTDATQKKQHLEAALAAFRAVQPDDAGIHRDYALYHEGRILDWLERDDEAVAVLEKALEVVPETELESEINTRLATLGAAQ